jgi:hypothetical protein
MSNAADDDDEEMEAMLYEFCEEHEREPYSSHELAKWYAARMESCARQMQMQLEMRGLKITADGKVVTADGKIWNGTNH